MEDEPHEEAANDVPRQAAPDTTTKATTTSGSPNPSNPPLDSVATIDESVVRPSPHSRHRPKRQREPILGSDPSDGGDAGGGKSESPRVVPLPNEPDTAPPPDDTGAVEPDVPVPPPAPKRARTEEDGSNNDAKEGDADGTPHHLAPSEPSRASEAAPHLSVEELAGAVGSDNGGDGAAAVVLPSVLSASLPAWAAASAPPVEEEGMGLPRGANPLPHVTAASAATLPPLPSGGGLRENGAPTPTSSAVRDRLRRHGATAASDGGGGGATMSRPSRKAAQRNTTTGPDANADSDHDDHEDGEEGDGQPHLRVLKRRVAREDEALLRQQVQDEYAQFLHCDECLEENTDLKVSAQTAKFNRMFEDRFVDLLVFGKAYGHLHVPKLYQDNPPLGRWVVKIRAWKKRADPRLTESRKNRLDGVGFIWDPKNHADFWKVQGSNKKAEELWEMNFAELNDYKEEFGDCLVPKEFPRNQRLARWVTKQRKHFKAKREGNYHSLDDDKERRLVDVGFVFNTKTKELMRDSVLRRYEDRWEEFLERLLEFKFEFGHTAVPRRWKRDPQLASWVMRQRFQWRKMNNGQHSYLSKSRLARLTEIGFVFGEIDRKQFPVGDAYDSEATEEAGPDYEEDESAEHPDGEGGLDIAEENAAKSGGDAGSSEAAARPAHGDGDEENQLKPKSHAKPSKAKGPSPGKAKSTAAKSKPPPSKSSPRQLRAPPAGTRTSARLHKEGSAGDKVDGQDSQATESDDAGARDDSDSSQMVLEAARITRSAGRLKLIRTIQSGSQTEEAEDEGTEKGEEGTTESALPEESAEGAGNSESLETLTPSDTGAETTGNELTLEATEPQSTDTTAVSLPSEEEPVQAGDAKEILGEDRGKSSTEDADASGVEASMESNQTLKVEEASEETMKASPEEEEVIVPPPVVNANKGRWVCTVCQSDDFYYFVEACAHEAWCKELGSLTLAATVQLE